MNYNCLKFILNLDYKYNCVSITNDRNETCQKVQAPQKFG